MTSTRAKEDAQRIQELTLQLGDLALDKQELQRQLRALQENQKLLTDKLTPETRRAWCLITALEVDTCFGKEKPSHSSNQHAQQAQTYLDYIENGLTDTD